MSAPLPRHNAEALAQLGEARVLEARAYLDAWSSLVSSGVPKHELRHYLDKKTRRTPSTDAVEAWGGRAGVLLLVGNRGSGKSHEGVGWLYERHASGRMHAEYDSQRGRWRGRVPLGRWLTCSAWLRQSWATQQEVLELAAKAPALVVDDLGAGGSGESKDAHKKINGLLVERFSQSLPTLVLLNGSEEDLVKWLDSRLVSRLEVAGAIVDVSGESLRTGETDDVNHPDCPCGHPGRCGHGSLWRVNHEIVELMGCEYIPRATGERGDGPVVHRWRVGLGLVLGANNRRNGQAAELLGLERGKARELAAEMAANDKTPSLQAELKAALLNMASGADARAGQIDGIKNLARAEIGQVRARMRESKPGVHWEDQRELMSFDDALAEHEAELAALSISDMQRRAAAARARADTTTRTETMRKASHKRATHTGESWTTEPLPDRPRATMSSKPPAWTQAEDGRAKLKRAGFEVKGPAGGVVVSFRGQVKLNRVASVATGWEQAALLAGLG